MDAKQQLKIAWQGDYFHFNLNDEVVLVHKLVEKCLIGCLPLLNQIGQKLADKCRLIRPVG